MPSLEERLKDVTRIDVSDLQNFRLLVDSHPEGAQPSLDISAKTSEPFPVRLVEERGGLTLKISSPHGTAAGRSFAFVNISGAYVTGPLSSVDDTTAPLEMTFSRTGAIDVEVTLKLPPAKDISVATPKNDISTRTPSRGGSGGSRSTVVDNETAKEIYRSTMREVGEKLRDVADKLRKI